LYDRTSLQPEECRESNIVGFLLLGAALAGAAYFLLHPLKALPALFVCLLLVIPVSAIFSCEKGWPRTTMTI
jgi:hypothetical protein